MRVDKRDQARPGWIYLIHFDQPYEHARHYLGFVDDPSGADLSAVQARLDAHQVGQGARLMAVVVKACVPWRLALVKRGTRAEERRMKNRGGSARHCPVCRAESDGSVPVVRR